MRVVIGQAHDGFGDAGRGIAAEDMVDWQGVGAVPHGVREVPVDGGRFLRTDTCVRGRGIGRGRLGARAEHGACGEEQGEGVHVQDSLFLGRQGTFISYAMLV